MPVVLLVLPGCDQVFGLNRVSDPALPLGPLPRGSALFCDIEKMSAPRRCATQNDVGVVLSNAAVALTTRNSQGIGLDYSEAARSALNCGSQPVVVTYEGRFPEGYPVCVKCIAAIGTPATRNRERVVRRPVQRPECRQPDQAGVLQFCQDRLAPAQFTAGRLLRRRLHARGACATTTTRPRCRPSSILAVFPSLSSGLTRSARARAATHSFARRRPRILPPPTPARRRHSGSFAGTPTSSSRRPRRTVHT